MIRLKDIINESEVSALTARDIYNFYVLWYFSLHSQELISTNFGKETLNYYINNLKSKYLSIFTKLIINQIRKYVNKKRIDADFPLHIDLNTAGISQLKELMGKTFRSDMKRRNDVWNMVADFTEHLSSASSPSQIFLYIDRLNNSIHNTSGKVLDKLDNYYYELRPALDKCHSIKNISALLPYVDSDIRQIKNQDVYNGDSELSEGLIHHLRQS